MFSELIISILKRFLAFKVICRTQLNFILLIEGVMIIFFKDFMFSDVSTTLLLFFVVIHVLMSPKFGLMHRCTLSHEKHKTNKNIFRKIT